MSLALDLYAMTNPALGCAVLWSFLDGAETGLEYPVLFLPLPILLSSSLSASFEGTNSRTGFFAWLDRAPELAVGMAPRVTRTAEFTRRSILYGSQIGAISVNADGRFSATDAIRESRLRQAGSTVRPLFPLARRLGSWVASVGSSRDVLYAFGITL
jgi:hypothetical protein